MRFLDIRNALLLSWEGGAFGLPTAYLNEDPSAQLRQAQDAGAPWAGLFVVPAQPGAASLGDHGQDRHDGFLQVDLNYPLNTGTADALIMADRIATRYRAGERFTPPPPESGPAIKVLIRSCGYEQPRRVENWSRTSMTIYYSAWVSRA